MPTVLRASHCSTRRSSTAILLARRVLDRGLRGFYHSYFPSSDRLSYVRGRIDLKNASLKPWEVKLKCHFEEHRY
jgi:5-methylcytosine-specific restriction enzyme subunit McrC